MIVQIFFSIIIFATVDISQNEEKIHNS